ncbi:MAG: hypothetical protein AAFO79_08340, partial [Pseudomonadota bacterium]
MADQTPNLDRRQILVTGGAATLGLVAGTSHAAAAQSSQAAQPAPAVVTQPNVRIEIATCAADHAPLRDVTARALADAGQASGSAVEVVFTQAGADRGDASCHAALCTPDAAHGASGALIADQDPAAALFAGFMTPSAPGAFEAWLTVGGGAVVGAKMFSDHGVAPILLGAIASPAGSWSSAALETVDVVSLVAGSADMRHHVRAVLKAAAQEFNSAGEKTPVPETDVDVALTAGPHWLLEDLSAARHLAATGLRHAQELSPAVQTYGLFFNAPDWNKLPTTLRTAIALAASGVGRDLNAFVQAYGGLTVPGEATQLSTAARTALHQAEVRILTDLASG